MTQQIETQRSLEQVLCELFSKTRPATIIPRDGGGWTVRRASRSLPEVQVAADAGGWSLGVPQVLVDPTPDQCWQALEWNRSFDGTAKLLLDEKCRAFDARSEIPGDDELDPAPALRQAFQGLASAVQRIRRLSVEEPELATSSPVTSSRVATESATSSPGADLAALCAAVDWSSNPRANGFAMALETSVGFHQALVELDPRWGVVARVELLVVSDPPEHHRQAAGWFLLEANRLVRFARAIRWQLPDAKQAIGFEVCLGHDATPPQLSSALAALSVACHWSAREIEPLGDERVARVFGAAKAVFVVWVLFS